MRALVDADGVVVNVIELEDGAVWTPPPGLTVLDAASSEGATIGARWDGTRFISPAPKVTPEQVDAETARVINAAMHPEVPHDEQIGILRAQLVAILNKLGLESIPEFAELNRVAVTAIEAARRKKEALNA